MDTVADPSTPVNPDALNTPPDGRRKFWHGSGSSSGSDAPDRSAAAGAGPISPAEEPNWFYNASELDNLPTPDLVQAAASILRPDLRRAKRHASIQLRPFERDIVRRLRTQAARCETGVMAVGRIVDGDQHAWRERMLFRPRCCSRSCSKCDLTRRERQASRCEGPWRLFVTLGLPHDRWSAQEAWMQAPAWASSLFAKIRDYGRRGRGGEVRVCYPFRARQRAEERIADPNRRPPSLIRYAWVLEPHKSGYPHLHAVISCDWLGQAWLKSEWSKIVGCAVRWCKIRRVTNVSGVCRYLSKYLTKTRLPLDVLAVLGTGRMWACTLPARVIPGEGWRVDPPANATLLYRDLKRGISEIAGARVVAHEGKPGVYAIFRSPVSYDWLASQLPDYGFDGLYSEGFVLESEHHDPQIVSYMWKCMGYDPNLGAPSGVPRHQWHKPFGQTLKMPSNRITGISPRDMVSNIRAIFGIVD